MQILDWESGKIYSNLLLTGKSYFDRIKRKRVVEIICKCGTIKWIRFDSIKSGKSTSCGCIVVERLKFAKKPAVTHGLSSHPLYTVYKRLLDRCYNETHKAYPNYGGRGVTVCDEWRNDFLSFYEWAKNKWAEGLELDKDILYCQIHGGKRGEVYSPKYCQFVTGSQNKSQTSVSRIIEYNGIKKTMKQWTDSLNFGRTVLSNRIDRYGWSVEKAITTPLKIK